MKKVNLIVFIFAGIVASCSTNLHNNTIRTFLIRELNSDPKIYANRSVSVRGTVIGNCLWTSRSVYLRYVRLSDADYNADHQRIELPPNEDFVAIERINAIALVNNQSWRSRRSIVEGQEVVVRGKYLENSYDLTLLTAGGCAQAGLILEQGEEARVVNQILEKQSKH
ncbi:MAG: hypothetical protein AAB680_00580 [Pseudomonadota bacterium]